MSQDLTIWLPLDFSAPWHWQSDDAQGIAETDTDKQALSSRAGSSVTLIIPGQWVRIFAHDLPKMRDADKLFAAAFTIEDKLGQPLAEQHCVVASGEDRRIAVITKAKIQAVQSALAAYGLSPDHMHADFDSFPSETAPLYLPDRTIQPGPEGYTLDRGWTDGAQPAATSPQGALAKADTGGAVNLVTGAFARKLTMPISTAALIKIAAAALICIVSWAAFQSAQNRALSLEASATRAQIAALYTDYTGEAAPANPALTVTRAVQQGSNTSADFIGLSSILFKALPDVGGVTVETLQYDAAKNELTARFVYPQFESATALEQAVIQSGGTFRAGGVREQSGRLIGDAAIAFGGAP